MEIKIREIEVGQLSLEVLKVLDKKLQNFLHIKDSIYV